MWAKAGTIGGDRHIAGPCTGPAWARSKMVSDPSGPRHVRRGALGDCHADRRSGATPGGATKRNGPSVGESLRPEGGGPSFLSVIIAGGDDPTRSPERLTPRVVPGGGVNFNCRFPVRFIVFVLTFKLNFFIFEK